MEVILEIFDNIFDILANKKINNNNKKRRSICKNNNFCKKLFFLNCQEKSTNLIKN